MIITFAILLAILIFVTWIFSMFLCWKVTEDIPLTIVEIAPFLKQWNKGARLFRRGWYLTNRHTRDVIGRTRNNAANIIVKTLPQSAHLFVKQNKLSGLEIGPTSYYLKKISQKPKISLKRLPKSKKMI